MGARGKTHSIDSLAAEVGCSVDLTAGMLPARWRMVFFRRMSLVEMFIWRGRAAEETCIVMIESLLRQKKVLSRLIVAELMLRTWAQSC
jgi:hypothetical protein